MSTYSSFLSSNSSENDLPDDPQFEIDDYLSFHEEAEESFSLPPLEHQRKPFLQQTSRDYVNTSVSTGSCSKSGSMAKDNSQNCRKRVAFKTKSDHEILDDGYKWRKYGKKMVKNSPNPRNYYRCSNEGCNVKKRIERLQEDSSYVITTYEGIHNHPTPSNATVNHRGPIPLRFREFSAQASTPTSICTFK